MAAMSKDMNKMLQTMEQMQKRMETSPPQPKKYLTWRFRMQCK